jgi:L-seryl-tRNA(Ser) seleniumtransferase
MTSKNDYRSIPSVDDLISDKLTNSLIKKYGRKIVLYVAKELQSSMRKQISQGLIIESTNNHSKLKELLKQFDKKTINVINATGVIIHTNLGRIPLSKYANKKMNAINKNYSNLEINLNDGMRGNRHDLLNQYLKLLTGAEMGFAVNNNASAVMLVINSLASKGEVIISRGELVEIGGGFRIPEIIEATGSTLIEVGTTNKTYIKDYQKAITKKTKAILRVHASNFDITGFTDSPTNKELSQLAHKHDLPLIEDLGSGTLLDTSQFNLPHEPLIQDSIKADIDIVTFSGDKLLGGPQSGIIIGKTKYIDKINSHPMARADRLDKSTLIGLISTLEHYVNDEAIEEIPVWQMINMQPSKLSLRVDLWIKNIKHNVKKEKGFSKIGGGTMPNAALDTFLLSLKVPHITPETIKKELRLLKSPIIARISNEKVLFDPRTIPSTQDKHLIQSINNLNKKLQLKK